MTGVKNKSVPGKMDKTAFTCICIPGVLLAVVFFCTSLWASDPATVFFPLANPSYKAQTADQNLTGSVGETITLSFTLDPPQEPVGAFLTVNMSKLDGSVFEKESKPKLLTGFPDTSMVFYRPGVYRYSVVVSLIAKGSCGGVESDTIYNEVVQVEVLP